MTNSEYIQEQLPEEVLYAQLAEEAAELAQAALKMHRILDGRNPTPIRLPEARANLMEEVADIINVLQMLSISPNAADYQETIRQKVERWAERLREHSLAVSGHNDSILKPLDIDRDKETYFRREFYCPKCFELLTSYTYGREWTDNGLADDKRVDCHKCGQMINWNDVPAED